MDTVFVLPLTAEACDYFWLPNKVDGAVGPGVNYGRSHPQDVFHAVHIRMNPFHQPLHGGCGDPLEGTAAVPVSSPGDKTKRPARQVLWGARVRGHQGIWLPFSASFRTSLLLIHDSQRASGRLSGSPVGLGLRAVILFLSPYLFLDSGSTLTSGLSATEVRGKCDHFPHFFPNPLPWTQEFLLGPALLPDSAHQHSQATWSFWRWRSRWRHLCGGQGGPFPEPLFLGFGFFAGAFDGTGQGHRLPSCGMRRISRMWSSGFWVKSGGEMDWNQPLGTRTLHGHFTHRQCFQVTKFLPTH